MIGTVTLEPIAFHGWSAWRLANDLISVVAVPELGGRVLSIKLADHEFLFMNAGLRHKEASSRRATLRGHRREGKEKT